MMFRVTIKRVELLEAEIEAEDADDAREQAQSGHHDWQDASGGRGLGDDDVIVLDVEPMADKDDEDEDHDEHND
jgi:hypothetical protein